MLGMWLRILAAAVSNQRGFLFRFLVADDCTCVLAEYTTEEMILLRKIRWQEQVSDHNERRIFDIVCTLGWTHVFFFASFFRSSLLLFHGTTSEV